VAFQEGLGVINARLTKLVNDEEAELRRNHEVVVE
jgi:hypothetical protein